MPKPKHAEPHFNEDGGCVCVCRRCVRTRMEEVDDGAQVRIRQSCCCKDCSEDCPPANRSVFAYIAAEKRGRPASLVVSATLTEHATGRVVHEFTVDLLRGPVLTAFHLPATADARVADMTQYDLRLDAASCLT